VAGAVAPEANFVDPILGLRVNTPLDERWSLIGYFDVCGFGVGAQPTLQATVTANYQATDTLFLSFGWRHLCIDCAEGGATFEGAMSGPVIGATLRF
jgi:hypothetical protein